MKLTFILLSLLAQLAALHGAASPKPVKVFFFAGQSNMVGADARPEQIDEFPMFKGAVNAAGKVRRLAVEK